jgi:uncharacterized membrane protein YhaH (DUF805 family)
MDFGSLFFKFDGRINRAKFWIAAVIYFAVYVVLYAVGYLTNQSMAWQAIYGMLGIVIFISSFAVGIKRLHDRNRSGWFMVLFYIVPGILVAVSAAVTLSGGPPLIGTLLALAGILIGVWALVELGCLRGSIGGNQYGPDPIAPQVLTPPVRTH